MNLNQKTGWDAESKSISYCSKYIEYAEQNRWFDMLLLALKKVGQTNLDKANVLELGGGSQFLTRKLVERYPNCNIICTDISHERLVDFQKYYSSRNDGLTINIKGEVNAEKLPFDDYAFDLILGDAVLHHIEDIRQAFLEINRCLKMGEMQYL